MTQGAPVSSSIPAYGKRKCVLLHSWMSSVTEFLA